MPTPRPFAAYPQSLSEMFLEARSSPVTKAFDTARSARLFRNSLYAFRTAALADLEAAGSLALLLPLARMHLDGSQLTIYYPETKAIPNVFTRADKPSRRVPNKSR